MTLDDKYDEQAELLDDARMEMARINGLLCECGHTFGAHYFGPHALECMHCKCTMFVRAPRTKDTTPSFLDT